MSAEVRRAPGWWPSLVQVACDDCGYRGRVIDLGEEESAAPRVRVLARDHVCGRDEDES